MLPRVLFTNAECRALGRCPYCGWHPPKQGHHANCPRPQKRKGSRADG